MKKTTKSTVNTSYDRFSDNGGAVKAAGTTSKYVTSNKKNGVKKNKKKG